MANYNSGYNNGYNRDRRGGGQGGGYTKQNFKPAPAEILPEKMPEDFIDRAEKLMAENYEKISTSKLRSFLGLISESYDEERRSTSVKLSDKTIARLGMLRIHIVYEAGRDSKVSGHDSKVKIFVQKTKLLEYLKGIGNDRKAFINYAQYMEALVAYHRYYGGRGD